MVFFASAKIRRNSLASVLCLLAVLFALEAKTAWYGPANGPGSEIRSQKARPADLPALVAHGDSLQAQSSLPMALVLLAFFPVVVWMEGDFLRGIDLDFSPIPVSAASYFSASLFFRPPPPAQ